nr:mechanosensitive ion channel domain-containing protein [Kineosporia babensis]
MDVADNRRIRRARTQITLVRRVLGVVVIVLGVAAVLMSFPQMRTFGASLLASAGVAGIIAGLAAQTTLGNMFAGLQLAFTDAVRIDDVVVVEGEWGWIEEITLTYVVVHLWDERRLVLPTSYFVTTPFQNWTRNQARILGSVMLYLDYATPLTELREYAQKVIDANPLWDRQAWVLQVVDTTETTMLVRVLASAHDGPSAWDLRCDIREALLTWLQTHHPQALPVQRNIGTPGELGFRDGVVTSEETGRNGAKQKIRPPRSRHDAPVMPDPQTAHLDLQMPNHAADDDEDAEPLDPRGRPSGDGGAGVGAGMSQK